jgi:hypothetical protein
VVSTRAHLVVILHRAVLRARVVAVAQRVAPRAEVLVGGTERLTQQRLPCSAACVCM